MKFEKIRDGIVQIDGSIIVLENVTTVTSEYTIRPLCLFRLLVNGVPVYETDDQVKLVEVKRSLIEELKAFHRAYDNLL